MIMTKHLPLVAMHNRHDLWSLCVATLAGTLQHSQSTTRFLYLGGGALDAERPFVRRDAEHRDEDALSTRGGSLTLTWRSHAVAWAAASGLIA